MCLEGAILGLDWRERCRNTAEVISVAMEVGLPIYFTQLEQVFDQYEAYSVEKLLLPEPLSGSNSPLKVKKEGISDVTPVLIEPKVEAQGEPQSSSQIEEDKASRDEFVKGSEQSSKTPQGDEASFECRHRVVDTPTVKASATVRQSPDEICSRLESFLELRDISAETKSKLKELFSATQSSTAKENLLLSLR